MMGEHAFNDALDASIDALHRGEDIGAILARYPHHAHALRPLLEAAALANPSFVYEPPSARLRDNFSMVQSSLRRSQMGILREPPAVAVARGGWWNRRLAFASMSLPAGVFALALVGAGSAAAATVAATTDIDEGISSAVSRTAPSWAKPDGHGGGSSNTTQAGAESGGGSPTGAATAGMTPTPVDAGEWANRVLQPVPAASAPGNTQLVQLSGIVSNVRGNTFELLAGGVLFKVQTDAKTAFSGALVNGATADVSGVSSGNSGVHADAVTITGTPEQSEPPQSATEPPSGPPAIPPGQADKTKTPPGIADKTKTPAGQPEKAQTPGPPATPPGQSGEHGGGNGNGSTETPTEEVTGNGNANGGSNAGGNGN